MWNVCTGVGEGIGQLLAFSCYKLSVLYRPFKIHYRLTCTTGTLLSVPKTCWGLITQPNLQKKMLLWNSVQPWRKFLPGSLSWGHKKNPIFESQHCKSDISNTSNWDSSGMSKFKWPLAPPPPPSPAHTVPVEPGSGLVSTSLMSSNQKQEMGLGLIFTLLRLTGRI